MFAIDYQYVMHEHVYGGILFFDGFHLSISQIGCDGEMWNDRKYEECYQGQCE